MGSACDQPLMLLLQEAHTSHGAVGARHVRVIIKHK
jgi:hypothetical protein